MLRTMARAAVLREIGQPLEVVEVEVGDPGEGQIRVAMAASGVCHSDLSAMTGVLYSPVPSILGHEGSGVVADVGPGVVGIAVGDHVVLSWVAQCGTCWYCRRGESHLCQSASTASASRAPAMTLNGRPLAQMMGIGTFASETVIPATAAVVIPAHVPLAQAALVGCGVLTGVGAARKTARIRPGDTVAVVGCGGVGLNVVQGARLAGAGEIIAIDVMAAKLDLATRFGATATIDASEADAVTAVQALTEGRGADVAFEVIGGAATVRQAIDMTRPGGQTVFVGIGGLDVRLGVPVQLLVGMSKTLTGCLYGSSNVQVDVPDLLGHYAAGDLHLDELISRRIDLDGVNDALRLLELGEVTRSVIEF
jgi:Zn-dependent alcohol dehydrogenase